MCFHSIVPSLRSNVTNKIDIVIQMTSEVSVDRMLFAISATRSCRFISVGHLYRSTNISNEFTLRHFVLDMRARQINRQEYERITKNRHNTCKTCVSYPTLVFALFSKLRLKEC